MAAFPAPGGNIARRGFSGMAILPSPSRLNSPYSWCWSAQVNIQLLIDAIVRQTTVLIAQLATSGGARAPLTHVASQVFLDLSDELNSQGISRKVSADMFGLALRTYLRKIQRLSESSTERGRSLSQAVLDFLSEGRVVTRAELFRHFRREEESLLGAVLHDLTETGLVFRSGSGEAAAYRAVTSSELQHLRRSSDDSIDELLWAIIYRCGPLDRPALVRLTGAEEAELDATLARLLESGRVHSERCDGGLAYTSNELVVALDSPVGWEASVYDHFHAVVKTICCRLQAESSARDDRIGGSTYTFDVWPGHPHEEEAADLLRRLRQEVSALRQRVEAHNAEHGLPSDYNQIVFYCGQCVVAQEANDKPESDSE
jgi:hypothetical protein